MENIENIRYFRTKLSDIYLIYINDISAIHIEPTLSKSKEGYSSLQASLPSPLRELTCHMGSHSGWLEMVYQLNGHPS